MKTIFDKIEWARARKTVDDGEIEKGLDALRATLKKKVSAFGKDSPEKKRDRVDRAGADFDFYCRTYFPHGAKLERGRIHEDLDAQVDAAIERLAMAAFRGSGKTARYTIMRCCYYICYPEKMPEKFMLLIGREGNIAKGYTGAIMVELETNPRLKHDFGNLSGSGSSREWAKGDFVTANGVTVIARGMGQSVRGQMVAGFMRPGVIHVDDLEDKEISRNPSRVDAIVEWINEEVLPAFAIDATSKGLFWMQGNYFGLGCVIDQFLGKSKVGWFTANYPIRDENGKSTWPAKYPEHVIDELREDVGVEAFEVEYMGMGKSRGGKFRREWMKFYVRADLKSRQDLFYVGFADLSAKEAEVNDFKSFTTLGMNHRFETHVADVFIRHCSVGQFLKAIFERYLRFRHRLVGFETNGFQILVKDEIRELEIESGIHLPLRCVEHSKNKDLRIGVMSPAWERGLFYFPVDWESDPDMAEFLKQHFYYPSSRVHDDGPDSAAGAFELGKELILSGQGKVKSARPRGFRSWAGQY